MKSKSILTILTLFAACAGLTSCAAPATHQTIIHPQPVVREYDAATGDWKFAANEDR